MTIEDAIRAKYGIKVPITSPDLQFRRFRVDELRNGFLMKGNGIGVFGSIIDGERFLWSEEGVFSYEVEHKESKDIRFEWLIWEVARSAFKRGERLSRADSERLALAVQRLEMWL